MGRRSAESRGRAYRPGLRLSERCGVGGRRLDGGCGRPGPGTGRCGVGVRIGVWVKILGGGGGGGRGEMR